MASKSGMSLAGNYEQQALHVLGQLSGAIEGLTPAGPRRVLHPLQQGRFTTGNGMPDSHCCAVVPTHCFRTVSQRSLSTPVNFTSQQQSGPPNIPSGTDLYAALINSAQGALPGVTAAGPGIIFNNANVQDERARIYDLVLIGIRAVVTATIVDATPSATQTSLCADELQSRVEEITSEYVTLKVYHTADRNDPWIDETPLKYFMRENDEFLPVPPVKWIDRDPAMELGIRNSDFGANAGAIPAFSSSVHDFDGTLNILVESLFIPDPDSCGPYWPGELCAKDMVANTKGYKGGIPSAKLKASR